MSNKNAFTFKEKIILIFFTYHVNPESIACFTLNIKKIILMLEIFV